MPQVHRMFFHYSELPLSMRTLYTATLIVLGIGYLFAMIQIYEVDAGRDGKPGLSADDIAIAYSGNKTATRLEAALSGPMSGMLPEDERATIIGWVHHGLDRTEYDAGIKPIIDRRCLACHDGSNPHIPNLNSYDNLTQVAQIDTGMSLASLVRVSHIHMFGITFIFFIMGSIFSHAYVRPVWFKWRSHRLAVPLHSRRHRLLVPDQDQYRLRVGSHHRRRVSWGSASPLSGSCRCTRSGSTSISMRPGSMEVRATVG